MQPLYIILGVIVIFLVLLHLTKQNDDIVEKLETVCIGRTCVDENQIKNLLNNSNNYVYGVNRHGSIYERKADGSGSSWRRIYNFPGGKTKHISVGNHHIWGTSPSGNIYKCNKPCHGAWKKIPGALVQLDTN